MSKTRQQIIAMNIQPNISRSRRNQTKKFGYSKFAYSMGNIIVENHA